MGEAKLRRDEWDRPVKYKDAETGEIREARHAGDPEGFVERYIEGKPAAVPCRGCVSCCYYGNVDLKPGKERPEDLPYLDTITVDGVTKLRKRPDGACIHLGETGCTVYEHRPWACRTYDCRIFSMFGIVENFDAGRQTPVWAFKPRTRKGQIVLSASNAAGMMAAYKFMQEGKDDFTAVELLVEAMKISKEFMPVCEAVSQLSRDEVEKAMGVPEGGLTDAVANAKVTMAKTLHRPKK